jgi:hypothetical protein
MAEYFPVNDGVDWGSKLKQFRNQLRSLVDLGRDIQGKARATVVTGTPNDYSKLESVFGLTAIPAATGEDTAGRKVQFQIDSVMDRLDSNAQQNNNQSIIQKFLDEIA